MIHADQRERLDQQAVDASTINRQFEYTHIII